MAINPANFTLNDLLEYLARGHGFPKHAEGMDTRRDMNGVRSFTDTDNAASPAVRAGAQPRGLGPDLHIETAQDLQDYMRRMLSDPATEGFIEANGSVQLYNRADNTRLIVNPFDNNGDFGTIHRYPTSRADYAEAKNLARREVGRSFVQFDNAVTRDAALTRVQGVVDGVRANPNAWRATLANNPGVVAAGQYPGSQNLATTGMSAGYMNRAATLDRVNAVRSGLDYGSGFVAQVDGTGRPSQMFFWDKETNVVTEINGRELIQHTFDNLPEAERARLAEQFFETSRPANAVVSEGGYDSVVRAFQSAHEGRAPVMASTKAQLLGGLENGQVGVATNIPYATVDDAARVLIGFSREQAQAFDLLPTRLNAEALAQIEDPAIISAIRDLATAKDMAHGDDGATALRLFAETFDGLDDATRVGVARTLETMARTPLPETARAAGAAADALHAADALDAMGDLARLARTARAGRLGLNFSKAGVITAVVTTSLAVATTSYANGAVLDIADQLHASGHLNDEAYADYRTMMESVGPMLTGQAADPTVLAIPGTFIVESIAHNRFQEFSDKHQLPQNIHEMLSPSIYSGSSVRGAIGDNTFRVIPDDASQAPAELRGLVEAKQGVMQARQEYSRIREENSPPMWMRGMMASDIGGALGMEMAINGNPQVQAAQAVMDGAQARFQAEFDRVLSNPQGARALASVLSNDQLLDIVEATARFNGSTGQDPLIQEFVRTQALDAPWYNLTGAWDNMQVRDRAREALLNNPEVMRDYLAGVFVPHTLHPAHYEFAFQSRETLENGRTATITATILPIDDHPNYVMMANAFERLKGGGTLERFEEEEIRHYLNHPQTDADRDLIEAIREAYPEQSGRYMDETSQSLPAGPLVTGASAPAQTVAPVETPLAGFVNTQPLVIPEPYQSPFSGNYTLTGESVTITAEELMKGTAAPSQNAVNAAPLDYTQGLDAWRMQLDGFKVDLNTNGQPLRLDSIPPIRLIPTNIDPEFQGHKPDLHSMVPSESIHAGADVTGTPEFIEIANAMEKIRSGEVLDATERQTVVDLLSDHDTSQGLLAAVQELYGQEVATLDISANAQDTNADANESSLSAYFQARPLTGMTY